VIASCRDFSITEAREHWGSPGYNDPVGGSRIVALMDWLERQPVPNEED